MGAAGGAFVVVLDALVLRRAALMALIAPWSERSNAVVAGYHPDEMGLPHPGAPAKLIVLSTGGASLRDEEAVRWAEAVRVNYPGSPCIIVSDRCEPAEAVRAAELGKDGFMTTSVDPGVALQAFALVSCGGTFFPREALLQGPGSGEKAAKAGRPDRLTQRQAEVLERLRHGGSNKRIAQELAVEESTIKVHVREIMRKLGASNRTEAAMLAGRVLVDPAPPSFPSKFALPGKAANATQPSVRPAAAPSARHHA